MNLIKINEIDNVVVVLKSENNIPAGHKIALCDIKQGEKIIKYGNVIGIAKRDIKKDDHVH